MFSLPTKIRIGCSAVLVFAAVLSFNFVIALVNPAPANGSVITPTSSTEGTPTGNLSDKVPKNYATLIKEAGSKFKLDPAIIAGIYLTEHHTDSFGKDIPSLDAYESGCSSNSSGARGPMQIIDGTWSGVVDNIQRAGISNPDRCRYRDAFYGGAAVIRGKLGFSSTKAACDIKDSKDTPNYSDECIKMIGHRYCGACTGTACGTRGYNYCDQTLRHYNLTKGSLAYLPPLLINDKERLLCYSNTEK